MILVPILIVVGALALDFAFGDPRNKIHPTAWVGRLVAWLVPFVKSPNTTKEKLGGVFVTLTATGLVASLIFLFTMAAKLQTDLVHTIAVMVAGAMLLKTTIAVKGLQRHGELVIKSLSENNLDEARARLSLLVKRNTKDLDRNHVVSGVLESTSENIVDGITGPLFYYGLFGLVGAFVYRTVNTIDSMVGYKNTLFANVGWFGANCDKVLNYVPARITAYVIVVAAFLIGADWKNSLQTMRRDGRKTVSPNAGYPMAAVAGALQTKFEKIDHYVLGDGTTQLDIEHFRSTILLMKVSCILFCVLVTIPLVTLLYYLGWWLHV
ncbi:MAG TPA: cobalamin biosynthesis protein [Candidatus Nitrosotenuis sp.]|nr:cobalamin biosynthesis protein [Candidatus Nitrosotenuis sp.]